MHAESQEDSYEKASLYGLVGDEELAMKWLEIAFEDGTPSVGFPCMPEFQCLHGNPRFIALLEKMNLPWHPEAP